MAAPISDLADVDPTASVGDGTAVWDHAQIRSGATIGSECVVGRGVYIGPGVAIGNRVKIQNLALIYEPAVLEDGVFVGPAVVLTNDRRPRAINVDGSLKSAKDWHAVGVHISTGAAIGAKSVCVAPVRVGAWSMVAAGSTVTKDVPDHALVAGTPARRIGWVGRSGEKLHDCGDGRWQCSTTGETYAETSDGLTLQTEEPTY